MRTLRVFLAGLCLAVLSGCWCHHHPFLCHRYGCCPTPCCAPVAPAPHCACYLGEPVPLRGEPPPFVAPQPQLK